MMASSPAPVFGVSAFVGREAELSVLTAALVEAAAGRGGLVLVAGEPGIGKTRLAEELSAVARRRDMRVLWGRCYEGEGVPAFWPWGEAQRHLEPAIAAFEAMQMAPVLARARDLAERLGGAPASSAPPPPYPDGLTTREVEVLRLIAAGLTNKEIAAELVLSPATVRRHTINLYAKIGAPGRAAATAYVFRHGLAGPPAP
jgi:DNA-binding CsgD family transcriptional regulator